MEVFIREKNCATCPFANKEKPNFICGDAIANDIGLKTNSSVCKLNYFANEESCPLKSLDQHDAEVRKQVIAELEEWVNKDNEFITRTYISPFREEKIPIVFKEDLQQKLNEMKGEKENV